MRFQAGLEIGQEAAKTWTTCWPPVPLAVAGRAISQTLTCVNSESRPQEPFTLGKAVRDNQKCRDSSSLVTFRKIPTKEANSSKNPPAGRRAGEELRICSATLSALQPETPTAWESGTEGTWGQKHKRDGSAPEKSRT